MKTPPPHHPHAPINIAQINTTLSIQQHKLHRRSRQPPCAAAMPISATISSISPPPMSSFHHTSYPKPSSSSTPSLLFAPKTTKPLSLVLSPHKHSLFIPLSKNAAAAEPEINVKLATGGGDGGDVGGRSGGGNGGGGGYNNDGDEASGDSNKRRNKKEALMALAEAGRSLESLPKDFKAALEDGRVPGSIVMRYFDLEKSGFLSWLMKFGGFKERLLADDLFLAKVGIECGVGLFTKTAAEYQCRKENFFNELEIVFADVVMAIIADFMLVYLPAPTVSLRSPLAYDAGRFAKFFFNCPANAFQIALPGTSFSLFQRIGSIARNGAKLFAVGTASSLVGTVVTNALINARKAVKNSAEDVVENVPVLTTSVAYGVYMSVSSNLRYQVLAGVIEQRFLEPLLHQHKLFLSAICFAVRTGNTFLGSLLWVKYARFIGIQ